MWTQFKIEIESIEEPFDGKCEHVKQAFVHKNWHRRQQHYDFSIQITMNAFVSVWKVWRKLIFGMSLLSYTSMCDCVKLCSQKK